VRSRSSPLLVNFGPLFRGEPQFFDREEAFSSITRKILKLAYYRNYCIDSNQVFHNDKDHQMPFEGRSTWKNRKIAISQERFDRLPRNLAG